MTPAPKLLSLSILAAACLLLEGASWGQPPDAGPKESAAAPDAGPPPEVTADNRCRRDADCVAVDLSCGGPCGSCPGASETLNRRAYRRAVAECDRERERNRRRWKGGRRPHVSCGRCRDEYYTSARCDRGACVLTGLVSKKTIQDLDEILGAPAAPSAPPLEPRIVRATMSAFAGKQARACIPQGALEAAHRVQLELRVAPDGQVAEARVAGEVQGAACLVEAARKLRFPASAAGARFKYPLRVLPASGP